PQAARGLLGGGGAGYVRLEAAPRPPHAGPRVEIDGHVPQLAAEAPGAAMEPPVEHDAAAHAGADREEHERARPAPRAPARLAKGERVHVVVDHGGRAR